jgi:uncharacterized protein YegJ (DUF2314 family)
MADDSLVPVFMPALAPVLVHAEDLKGEPLSEAEALRIRDRAACIMMKREHARQLEETRGYRDIDPENCWRDWQQVRAELGRTPLPAGPKVAHISNDDPEFQQSIQDARASLDQFSDLIARFDCTPAMPMVKTLVTCGKERIFLWLCSARVVPPGFVGDVFEIPTTFDNYCIGDEIFVAEDDVLDWMVNDEGVLYGGFSLRLLRSRLPETERVEYDEHVGVTRYA